MHIIVAGGRDFDDFSLLCQKMDAVLAKLTARGEELVVVSGTAKGADKLGERWTGGKVVGLDPYPANWKEHGNWAGIERNEIMADNAQGLVAFWDGKSKGTGHMINYARNKGLIVWEIGYNGYVPTTPTTATPRRTNKGSRGNPTPEGWNNGAEEVYEAPLTPTQQTGYQPLSHEQFRALGLDIIAEKESLRHNMNEEWAKGMINNWQD